MTAQFPETLIYQGERHAMCSTPLCDYFESNNLQSPFTYTSTALWRGYTGTWEVRDDNKLYLIKLHGTLRDRSKATLDSVFPNSPDGVFADWFTGTVRLPQGEQLQYVHAGFASEFERDLWLQFVDGILVKSHIINNTITIHENGDISF